MTGWPSLFGTSRPILGHLMDSGRWWWRGSILTINVIIVLRLFADVIKFWFGGFIVKGTVTEEGIRRIIIKNAFRGR